MTDNLFRRQNAIGKTGEEIVKQYYSAQGYEVIDVSNNKEYQKKDIDLIINGQTVEVKTATNLPKYKEFCIELVSNDNPARYKEGWFITSQADVVIFYSTQENTMYQMKLNELRQYYFENEQQFRKKRVEFREFGNIIKPSVLSFLPVQDVEMNIKAYRKVSIDFEQEG